jgi:hypothetical protein
LRIMVML